MWRLALCFFLILAAALAQEQIHSPHSGLTQEQVQTPVPPNAVPTSDPDADLLAIIGKLTDDKYVRHELTFEAKHTDLDIHKYRIGQINSLLDHKKNCLQHHD
jgi:hypothetical protein